MAIPRGCIGSGGGFSNGFSNGFRIAVSIVCPSFCPEVGDIATGLVAAEMADHQLQADIAELVDMLDIADHLVEGDADTIGVVEAEIGERVKQGQIAREIV